MALCSEGERGEGRYLSPQAGPGPSARGQIDDGRENGAGGRPASNSYKKKLPIKSKSMIPQSI